MMNRFLLLSAVLLLLSLNGTAGEVSLEWDWTLSAQTDHHNNGSLFIPSYQQDDTETVNGLLDLEARYKNWTTLLAFNNSNLFNSDDDSPESDLIFQELFVQDTFAIGDRMFDVQLGKMRLDWGVGYGYRPLDIIKRYQRNPVGIQVDEGAGVFTLSYFDAQGEWSAFLSDSSWNSQRGTELEERAEQQGAGLRRYWLKGDSEYQWLAYYDDVRRGLLGGSYVSVLNASWEIHSSALYQQHFLAYSIPEGTMDAVTLESHGDGFQGLVGFTWANASGHQLIAEYWFDNRAWSQDAWEVASSRAQTLTQEPSTSALGYAYAQGLNHANLVEHNLFVHWSLDGASLAASQPGLSWTAKLTPTLDLLYSPLDSGIIATQWLTYSLLDSGDSKIDVELAARFYTGSSESIYANLSDRSMILFNLKGRF